MTIFSRLLLITALLACSITSAHAYIGPGMGGGVIVAILGIVGAVFIGLFGIIYFPVKRALQKKKAAKEAEKNGEENSENDNNDPQHKP